MTPLLSHTKGKVKSSWKANKESIFNSDRVMWERGGFSQWHLLAAVAGTSWLEPKALWSSYWFSWHQKLISFPNTLDHVQNHPTSHSPNQSFDRSMWNWNLLLTTNEPREDRMMKMWEKIERPESNLQRKSPTVVFYYYYYRIIPSLTLLPDNKNCGGGIAAGFTIIRNEIDCFDHLHFSSTLLIVRYVWFGCSVILKELIFL